jgi:hypothetical protein
MVLMCIVPMLAHAARDLPGGRRLIAPHGLVNPLPLPLQRLRGQHILLTVLIRRVSRSSRWAGLSSEQNSL